MRILRTNTAVRICVGPMLDCGDAISIEGSLTVTGITAEIIHEYDDGTAVNRVAFTPAASGSSNDMIPVPSSTLGYYDLEITAAQVNFLGRAKFGLIDTDVMLPYHEDWLVVPNNVFDSLMGTALLDVNTAQWLGLIPVAIPSVAGDKMDIVDAPNSLATTAITDSVLAGITADDPTRTAIADSILAGIIEGTYDLKTVLRLLLAFSAGKASGAGTTSVIFRDTGDTRDRITMTTDPSGNRTDVILDGDI